MPVDDIYSLGISLVFEAGQQLAEYPGVEVNDGIGDQASALIP
ncbi:hypothetical protein MS6201_05100 [Escherichia coli]|nr:hypothetical protein [Escherichia coli]